MKKNLLKIFSLLTLSLLISSGLDYLMAANADSENVPCRSVLIGVGQSYWGQYFCHQCNQLYSARPNVQGRQQCPTCGKAHERPRDGSDDAINLPHDEVIVDGKPYLRIWVPEAAIVVGDPTAKFAGKGALQSCLFCGSSGFAIDKACGGCGAQFEKGAARSKAVRVPQVVQASSRPTSQAKPASGASRGVNLAEKRMSAPAPSPNLPHEFRPIRSNSGLAALRSVLIGSSIGATALSVAVGLTLFGRSPYIAEGHVVDVSGPAITVTYTARRGQQQQLTFIAENVGVRVGDSVELHGRRWGSIKGGETSAGIILSLKPKD